VQRAQALLAENGNSPAEFDFDEHSVLVKIHKKTKCPHSGQQLISAMGTQPAI
jgi:hypothetical protein